MIKFGRLINKILTNFGYRFSRIRNNAEVIVEMNHEEDLLIQACLKYSMTTKLRMWTLLNSIKYVKEKKIDGAFVECGIWKGGNIILFNKLNEKYGLEKKIFAYDTFAGMTKPGEYDFKYDGRSAMNIYEKKKNTEGGWAKSTLQEVKNNILKECNNLDNIKLIEGKVEDTLLKESNLPKKISILRLDTDFYESTKIELEVLYSRLEKNGILIIDDYGHFKGARKAVDQFFKTKPFLIYVDHTCRILVKN